MHLNVRHAGVGEHVCCCSSTLPVAFSGRGVLLRWFLLFPSDYFEGIGNLESRFDVVHPLLIVGSIQLFYDAVLSLIPRIMAELRFLHGGGEVRRVFCRAMSTWFVDDKVVRRKGSGPEFAGPRAHHWPLKSYF